MQSSQCEADSIYAAKELATDLVDKFIDVARPTRGKVKFSQDGVPISNDRNRDSRNYWHYKQTGIKSRPIKLLKHPIEHIERKIILTYILGILFRIIAVITGPLIVLVVYLITLPVVISRRSVWFILNLSFTYDARIKTTDVEGRKVGDGARWLKQREWSYCPLDYIESYWFKEKLVNNVILAIEHKGQEFPIEKLRSLVCENILSKSEFRKFLSNVVLKGVPFYKSYYWHHIGLVKQTPSQDATSAGGPTTENLARHFQGAKSASRGTIDTSVDQFSVTSITDESNHRHNLEIFMPPNNGVEGINLEQHIFIDNTLKSSSTDVTGHVIRQYAYQLLGVGLNKDRPLWEIRVLPTGTDKSYMIFRCHQSLADGRCLSGILTDHLTGLNHISLDQGAKTDARVPHEEISLQPLKERKSFIARMDKSSSSKSAILVGPLTVLLWVIWTFTRRKNNHLNKCCSNHEQESNANQCLQDRRFYMAQYSLTKFHQIKQMTRSSASDIILCALSGALRDYLRKVSGVPNPPNLNISLAVDMRQTDESYARQNQVSCDKSTQLEKPPKTSTVPQVNCTLVNVPLPTSVEGTVPRLWELRSTMDELRTSADPWVMLGLQYFLFIILPTSCYQWVINYIALRNSSALLSNIRGPQNMVESWCVDLLQRTFLEAQQVPTTIEVNPDSADYNILIYPGKEKSNGPQSLKANRDKLGRLKFVDNIGTISSIFYCMQPPTSEIPISFNCITYYDKLHVTTLSRSLLIEDSKLLTQLFFRQLDQLADTIAKRRSLVTIMRAPVPIEISCEPATPLSGLDSLVSTEDNESTDATLCKSQPRLYGLHKDDIEAGIGFGGRNEKCQACKQSICSCKRRKSLFSFDFDKQHFLNLLSPIHSGMMQTKSCELKQESRTPGNVSASGEQFLNELDEDAIDVPSRQIKDSASTGTRRSDEFQNLQPTHSRRIKKRSTISLNAQSNNEAQHRPDSFIRDPRNLEREISGQSSFQLNVPQSVGIYGKHHSKSETDLFPTVGMQKDSSVKSVGRLSPTSLFGRSNPKQQSSLSSGASSICVSPREPTTPPRSRNTSEISRLGKRYTSKRRKSVAIGSDSAHIQRYVVIKDKVSMTVTFAP